MANQEKGVAVIGGVKISKELKSRLLNKMMDKNDDKIIALMEQRQSHIEAVKRIDREIAGLTSLTGLE